jgi:hypothetical protein
MITSLDCLTEARRLGDHYQLAINAFIDGFRRATPDERSLMISDPLPPGEQLSALVAGVVSALARETGTPAPAWLEGVTSPEPFFVLPARSFEMRLRLMIESPPPFRNRGVFVPENYLSRA